ncbi:MAG: hypothetical protein KY476_07700 [Planctomycetes bacterium]|nr:hypothetical protein [Planctomycetota bacterium]
MYDLCDPETTVRLVERWRGGDEAAAAAIEARFGARLAAFAAPRIGPRLGRRLDSDDILQSAFRTFFRHSRSGSFLVTRSGQLWSLLIEIARRKVACAAERHTAARRSLRREAADGAALLDALPAEALDPLAEAGLKDGRIDA